GHTGWPRDWSSDVCSSDLLGGRRSGAKVGREQAVLGFEPGLAHKPPARCRGGLHGNPVLPEVGVEEFCVDVDLELDLGAAHDFLDRKSTRLNSSHVAISYA